MMNERFIEQAITVPKEDQESAMLVDRFTVDLDTNPAA
jgi:hypothetical protein